MKDKIKNKYEIKNKFGWIVIILGIIIPVVIIGIIWIKEGKCPFVVDYNADHWVGIFSGILSYVGTMTLGIVTILQNDRSTSIAEKSLLLAQQSFEKELNLLIPDIEIKIFDNKDMEENLFEYQTYSKCDYGCDASVNVNYREDTGFVQYGYVSLIIILKSRESIKNFRLEQLTIHKLNETNRFCFFPDSLNGFDLNEKDNVMTYAVKICASNDNTMIKEIFNKETDFQFNFKFSLYNILNKRIEIKQPGVYYNKKLYLFKNLNPQYKEEATNGQT